ncbi:hypothetical protein Tco_1071837 [Tanacetum coccineum]
MMNQNNELRNMMSNELKNMMSSFFQMQSPSGSGSLPSNTIANPRGDLKVITTQSGVSYDGPMIPPTSSPLPKEVEREPEATKDKLSSGTYPLPRMTLRAENDRLLIRLVLRRCLFEKTAQALIDVHGEELTLRVNDEAITFNVRHTLRYSYRYDDESVNRIDVIDVTCEEYAQEEVDFVLEEIEACLTSDSIPSGINDADFDPEGDILLLEKLLNDDPSSPLPPKEINIEELKIIKSYIDDPPELKLQGFTSHLE